MKKNILRILSFVMVAMFAFTLMGLIVGAQEWEIPVIEEVAEEDLGIIVEDVDVELFEGESVECEAQIYDANGAAGAKYATFEEALDAVAEGGTVKLLKDVEVLEGTKGGAYITLSKTFTLDGGGFTLSDNSVDKNSGASYGGTADGGTFKINNKNTVTVKDITFLRPRHKAYGFFWLQDNGGKGGTLIVSDKTVFKNLSAVHGSAVFLHSTKAKLIVDASSDAVAPQFIGCTNGNAVRMYSGTFELKKGIFTNCGNATNPAINVGVDNTSYFNMTGGTITSPFAVQAYKGSANINITGGTITGGSYAGIKVRGAAKNVTIGGNATITGCTTGIFLEEYTASGVLYNGGSVTICGNANLSGNTTAVDATSNTNAVVTVKDNATISGGTVGVELAKTVTLKVEGSPKISGTTHGVRMADSASIKVVGAYSGEIGVTVSDTANPLHFGTLEEGGSIAQGASFYNDADKTIGFARYEDFIGTGTSGSYSIFDKSVLSNAKEAHAGELWLNYPVYRVVGTTITGHKKVSEALSNITAASIYLTRDVAVNEMFTPATAGHVDIAGDKTVTVYGNGHTMTRTHDGPKNKDNFTLYSKINLTFKDFIYNGNNLSHFAWVYNGNNGAQLTLDNCVIYNGYHNARAGAVGVYANSAGAPAKITIKDTTIAECKGSMGAVSVASGSDGLYLSGKVVIKDNTYNSGTECNVYYEAGGKAKIYMTGDITDANGGYTPSVGITINKGITFGEAAATGYAGVDCFFADNAPVMVTGAYYPETIGDGKYEGATVITAPAVNNEKKLVLHYPWVLVDGTTEKGYVSFKTLIENTPTNESAKMMTARMQKDMTIKNMSVYTDSTERTAQYAVTEFPMFSGDGAAAGKYIDFNHKRMLTIDGNGHTLIAERADGNPVFVLYGGAGMNFENLVYDGEGNKRLARIFESSPATGAEFIGADNCYLVNGSGYIFEGNMHGTMDITDSTVSAIFVNNGCQATLDNVTFTGTVESAISMKGAATIGETTYQACTTLKNKITLPGKARVTLGDDYVQLVLDSTFDSEIVVNMANFSKIGTQISTAGLETLNSVKSLVKYNAAEYAYVSSYADGVGNLAWAKTPVLTGATDSGVYSDGTGLIRFMTTFEKAPSAGLVENFGTYALGANSFVEGMNVGSVTTFKSFTPGADGVKAPTADGQAFIVDVVNVPAANRNTTVNAISFVKLKGIATPVYYYYTTPVCVGDDAKDLGEKKA